MLEKRRAERRTYPLKVYFFVCGPPTHLFASDPSIRRHIVLTYQRVPSPASPAAPPRRRRARPESPPPPADAPLRWTPCQVSVALPPASIRQPPLVVAVRAGTQCVRECEGKGRGEEEGRRTCRELKEQLRTQKEGEAGISLHV